MTSRLKNITRAAKRLSVSQPNITVAIKKIRSRTWGKSEENYDDYLDQYHIESLVKNILIMYIIQLKWNVTTSKKKRR